MTKKASSVIIFHGKFVSLQRISKHRCIMTQTKKAFKDWDFSDFDFAHAESLADQPIRRNQTSFNGFIKAIGPCPQYKDYPTSNLADVL